MNEKQTRGYVGYIRISDKKQEKGASLPEQKRLLLAYAQKHGLVVTSWVVERKTASVVGRKGYAQMLRDLRARRFAGALVHKVDRGSRNLQEWGELMALSKQGLDIRLVGDDLDLTTRSGMLSANIQAVLAEDYIWNLREEVKKGQHGRMTEGLYPFTAPIGYLNSGKGKLKPIDPVKGPLVRQAFELYDRGDCGLIPLTSELVKRGLVGHAGTPISLNTVNRVLRNPFYAGVIKIRETGATYEGKHTPLIPMTLFRSVQARLDGRLNQRTRRFQFLFRRAIGCKTCRFKLIGELQKGRAYYRCHSPSCPVTSVREEAVEAAIVEKFSRISFDDAEKKYLKSRTDVIQRQADMQRHQSLAALKLRLEQIAGRKRRVTDAWIDRTITQDEYNERKMDLVSEEQIVKERLEAFTGGTDTPTTADVLELAGSASTLYRCANADQRRSLVENLTSNLVASGRNVGVMLAPPFSSIEMRHGLSPSALGRDKYRTLDDLLGEIQASLPKDLDSERQVALKEAVSLLHRSTEEKAVA